LAEAAPRGCSSSDLLDRGDGAQFLEEPVHGCVRAHEFEGDAPELAVLQDFDPSEREMEGDTATVGCSEDIADPIAVADLHDREASWAFAAEAIEDRLIRA
jgi:hypothetical protein